MNNDATTNQAPDQSELKRVSEQLDEASEEAIGWLVQNLTPRAVVDFFSEFAKQVPRDKILESSPDAD
jgi:hypothetical protein